MEDDEIIIGIKAKTKETNKKKSQKKTKKKNETKKINKKKTSDKNGKGTKVLRMIVFIIVAIVLLFLLLSSSLFNISTIEVEGNSKLSDEKIISISSIEVYTNIFNFSKTKAKSRLKENSYIENVEISRKLPSTIVITIEERVPTYMLQFADSYVYINNQGYMLDISNEKLDVPILTGFTTDLSNIKAGNRINSEDLKRMSVVIKIYQTLSNNGLTENLSKIDMSDEKDYILFFDNEGKKVHLGNDSDLSTKIVCLKGMLEVLPGKTGELFLNVDLNTERAYFRESVE